MSHLDGRKPRNNDVDIDGTASSVSAAVSTGTPALRVLQPTGPIDTVVLVLHGGQARSDRPTRAVQLAYQRMLPIAWAIHRAVRPTGTAVWLLRNRVRGWNEPRQDPVRDALWALARVRRHHRDARVVLVGHSMGGRVALRVAGEPSVVAVCALAPWVEPGEPVDQLSDRTVLLAHGDRDRWTDAAGSYTFALRARELNPRVCRFSVFGSGHAMVRRAGDWTGLVSRFVAGIVGAAPQHPAIVDALAAPAPDGLRRPLPAGVW